jgi:hypothetical protein
MRIGRGNRSTQRKPVPVPLCPPQIPHGLTWDRTRIAAVESWRLTAWVMARSCCCCCCCSCYYHRVLLFVLWLLYPSVLHSSLRTREKTAVRSDRLNKLPWGYSGSTRLQVLLDTDHEILLFSSAPPGKWNDISGLGCHRFLSDPFHFISHPIILRHDEW